MTTGASGENREEAQDTTHLRGKVLRLRDDGTPAPGNPFIGRAGFKPEIYSYGHRNQLGFTFHPQTGALWNAEHGPNGGDELNIIVAGKNYGWPVVSLGRDYAGPWQGKFAQDGHAAAGGLLDAVDRRRRSAVLQRQPVPRLARQRHRRIDAVTARFPTPVTCSASSSTSVAKRFGGRCS